MSSHTPGDVHAMFVLSLAELVAWYGQEANGPYLKRIVHARQLLRRSGHGSILSAEMRRAKEANDYNPRDKP